MNFTVARAFELFKDHLIHSGSGIDQCGGDDGERATFFDVSGGAKEALRSLQCIGIDTPCENFA